MSKLWKVELSLNKSLVIIEGEVKERYNSRFNKHKLENSFYKFNEDTNEWDDIQMGFESIPKDIKIYSTYGGYKAMQGFDKKPTDEELKVTKEIMKHKLFAEIQNDHMKQNEIFMNKLKTLSEV